METTIILALACLGLAGLSVWLVLKRIADARTLAELSVELRGLRQEESEASARAVALEAERNALLKSASELTSEKGILQTQLHAERERHRELIAHERERFDDEIRQREELYTARLHAIEQANKQARAESDAALKKMQEAFSAMATSALTQNNQQFLELAHQKLSASHQLSAAELEKRRLAVEQMVAPIAETLRKTDEKLTLIEKERASSYAALIEQVRAMQCDGAMLRSETAKLVKALREPQVRGRYGELQLKRVAELAGMRSYCDFTEQSQTIGDDGRAKRPDMIVKLPNQRELIVDAKANLKPYLDAMEAPDPESAELHLKRFADGVAEQARKLASKEYFSNYAASADFTVMFVPGDQFVDAALSRRSDLLEELARHNVILASPSTLIALLRAVAVGFRETKLNEDARAIQTLAKELHERAAIAFDKLARVGEALERATGAYNETVASVESRLLPKFRQIEESGVRSSKELPSLPEVKTTARKLASGELFRADD
jgi:DNA recombination protein RmuC